MTSKTTMISVVRAIVVALLFTTLPIQSALAQSYCDRPYEPNVPSGYSDDASTMERAKDDVQDYIDEMHRYQRCLESELSDAERELDNVAGDWQSAVRNYNNQ